MLLCREESAGVKSNRADLIGCPMGGTVSQRKKRSGSSLGEEARNTRGFAYLWRGKGGVPLKARFRVSCLADFARRRILT